MKEVVMDTNFLLIPYQFKIDIFKELDYVIGEPFTITLSTKVMTELKALSKRLGKAGAAARFALKLVEARGQQIKPVRSALPVDDWVFQYAIENHAIACTNDREIRNHLRQNKLKVIGLRTRSKLGYV